MPKKNALQFVVLLGLVSLLADVTYEGARSVTGPFLSLLGASGMVVGLVAGSGELIGYALRLASGYLSDRTGRYWAITIVGYAVNLLAVPALALAGQWPLAAALMIAERTGKAIRTPARDAMLSYATKEMGHGWGFGLHEAMDQIGAMTGPLIVALILYLKDGYRVAFGVLAIPAVMALAVLAVARVLYPAPQDLEVKTPSLAPRGFTRTYWFYLAAVACIAAAYADFPLIAFHFKKTAVVPDDWIPVFYAVAMGVDAISALVFGKFFDKMGLSILAGVTALSMFFAPLVFFGGFKMSLVGMALWGVGLGAQESVMRAAISTMTVRERRGTAFGIFNTGFGIFWFLGSWLMGALYDHSRQGLVIFSMALQAAAIPLFIFVGASFNREHRAPS